MTICIRNMEEIEHLLYINGIIDDVIPIITNFIRLKLGIQGFPVIFHESFDNISLSDKRHILDNIERHCDLVHRICEIKCSSHKYTYLEWEKAQILENRHGLTFILKNTPAPLNNKYYIGASITYNENYNEELGYLYIQK